MLLYGFIVHFRSTSLAHVNSMLREQLDQATDANRSLTQNIDQLNDEVRRSQEELDTREAEWRDEEKVSQWPLKPYTHHQRVCGMETSISMLIPPIPFHASFCWMRIERVHWASKHSLGSKVGPRRPFKFSNCVLARWTHSIRFQHYHVTKWNRGSAMNC